MGVETERKFLVNKSWQPKWRGKSIRQAYVAESVSLLVRVRIQDEGAYLTIKGPNTGISRMEFEYPIPPEDAAQMIKLAGGGAIEKERFIEEYRGKKWEIDVFHGKNEGLVVAEIELSSEDEEFSRPSWAGEEVTGDARYYNSNLIDHPYTDW